MSRPRRRLAAIVLLMLLGAVAISVIAVAGLRWRVEVLWLVASDQIPDLSLLEAVRMMAPRSPYAIAALREKPSPYLAISNPFTSPADSTAGEALFRTSCSLCHEEGSHGTAPRLRDGRLLHGASDWAMYRNITRGVNGTAMRAQRVTEREAWQLITYLRGRAGQGRMVSLGPTPLAPELLKLRPVDSMRLTEARQTPADWLSYSGGYDGWRYSGLHQITAKNVAGLRVQWILQLHSSEKVEVSPVVADGVMFLTEPPGAVVAVDASTGRQLWFYVHPLPTDLRVCCGQVNRGVAIGGNTLFIATLDAHLIALDARTGSLLWDTKLADYSAGYSGTGAPLVVGNRVIIGIAGGEFGTRGFLDAYDVASGARLWRFNTVPGPGEPGSETWSGDSWRRGAGPTWLTGSYDPKLGLIYWGVGNPGPNFDLSARPGNNLYTNSVIALDVATGKLRWHFQFTPHDEHDWDANQIPVLVDGDWQGRRRPLMLWANRNGFYYVLDRSTGEFLLGRPFVKQTWADSLTASGVPVRRPDTSPSRAGTAVFPSILGGTNWWSPSYSPHTGYLYVPVLELGGIYHKESAPYQYRPGEFYVGSTHKPVPADSGWTAIRAIRAETGEVAWDHRLEGRPHLLVNGVMATAGGVVFGSDVEHLVALDAASGRELWRFNAGGQIWAAPVAFEVGNTQLVVVAAGNSIMAFGLK
jgi:alcohol dehydrogenase (cytochrome c)